MGGIILFFFKHSIFVHLNFEQDLRTLARLKTNQLMCIRDFINNNILIRVFFIILTDYIQLFEKNLRIDFNINLDSYINTTKFSAKIVFYKMFFIIQLYIDKNTTFSKIKQRLHNYVHNNCYRRFFDVLTTFYEFMI